MSENWKWVPGHEGDLEVSDHGRVRRYLPGHNDTDGYLRISGGKRGARALSVHHLVASVFLGPRPEGAVVRHLNDTKTDNRASNLAYGTRADNWADGERNGIHTRHCPKRAAHLRAVAHMGGKWWAGKERNGLRGKVKP